MIAKLLWMLIAHTAVLLAARAVQRRLPTGRAAVDLLLLLLLRFAFIMGLVLAAGLAGILTPAGVGLPCAALLAGLLVRGERLDIPWKAGIPRELPRWALLLAALLVIRGFALAAFYTPIDADATSYHLPKIAEWVRTGSLQVDLGTDPRAWFPGGFELVEAWWVLFLHHDVLIEAAGLEFLFLAAVSTWALAGWLGLGPAASLLASLTVASIPGLSMQSLACLNDAPVAALVLAAAALITARVPPSLLIFVGGLAAGVKPTTVYAAPGLILLLFLVRKSAPAPAAPRVLPALLAVFGVLIGAYWYVRTWILTGNPLYPLGTALLQDPSGQQLQRLGFSAASLREGLADLVNHRIYDGRRMYHPLLEHAASWGAAVVACGLPSLVAGLRRTPRLRILAAAFALSLASVLSLVVNDLFSLRFILWFPALPALALAGAVERFQRLALPAAITLGFTIFASTFTQPYTLPVLAEHLLTNRGTTGGFRVLGVDPEPRTATFGTFGQRSYLLYGPDYRNQVLSIRADSPEHLRTELRRLKLGQLYAIDVLPASREGLILLEGVRQGWLIEIAPSIYRVGS